jgi:hypothetical protein
VHAFGARLGCAASGGNWVRVFRAENGNDVFDQMACGFDDFSGFGGFRGRRSSLRLGGIVGDGLHLIGVAEEPREVRADSGGAVLEMAEGRPQSAMVLMTRPIRSNRMAWAAWGTRQDTPPASDLREAEPGIRDGIFEMAPCSREKTCGLRCHRSIPSRRTSPVNAGRSLYDPAGKGFAEITSPMSIRMSVVMMPSGFS